MRPLRLEIKGFTAFRDEQIIDLAELDLFAIAGPTGSGKTSILDAMTYALFGEIERVGRQAGQFVSQGQTRMAVTLEFAVDEDRYRVTRTTPAKTGATRILLERWDGGGWTQAGEGADRVKEANAMIARAVGLDYDAFTRTVLLPQGRFAEFLVGDAKQRRDILTELLGLELFVRLAGRAGEIKREAEMAVQMHEQLLATEYAGVTPDALAEAEAIAKEAVGREGSLADAEVKVREVADRWGDTARTIRELKACSQDLREAAHIAAEVVDALEDVAGRASSADADVATRAKAVAAAEKDAAKAAAAREKAESAWGTPVDLARLRARAESLGEARDAHAEAGEELAAARGSLPGFEAASASAAERVTLATADLEASIVALDTANRHREEAQHADLVAAVRRGVHVGDDCPVCGTKIAALPKGARALSLEKADAALEKAKARASALNDALQGCQRTLHAATAHLEAARKDVQRAEKLVARAAKDREDLAAELKAPFGGRLPADPVAAVDDRLERLEGAAEEERVAGEALVAARDALVAAERARDGLAAEVAQARGRLDAIASTGLIDRARNAAGSGFMPPDLPSTIGLDAPADLAAAAAALTAALEGLAADLDERADAAASGEAEVFDEAAAHAADLLEIRSTELAELVAEVAAARTEAARACAMAEHLAGQLRAKLEHAAEIVERIAEQRSRAEVFAELARELQQNRLIAFVQAEALQLLAAAGSDHLQALSTGRYRLEYEGDAFSVVDTWNGEERRSAKTLSGGETFLASLALALALSEQVPSLAVTEKARLDSLFLDEGFGTLDPETLEVVVDAIEQLGGDGRMVGVITHVQELAIRLPARIEVQKSPRGSTLRVVTDRAAPPAALVDA